MIRETVGKIVFSILAAESAATTLVPMWLAILNDKPRELGLRLAAVAVPGVTFGTIALFILCGLGNKAYRRGPNFFTISYLTSMVVPYLYGYPDITVRPVFAAVILSVVYLFAYHYLYGEAANVKDAIQSFFSIFGGNRQMKQYRRMYKQGVLTKEEYTQLRKS